MTLLEHKNCLATQVMGRKTHREGRVQTKFVNDFYAAKAVLAPVTSRATAEDALHHGTYFITILYFAADLASA